MTTKKTTNISILRPDHCLHNFQVHESQIKTFNFQNTHVFSLEVHRKCKNRTDYKEKGAENALKKEKFSYIVADPGCFSRIPDTHLIHPGSGIRVSGLHKNQDLGLTSQLRNNGWFKTVSVPQQIRF
jgi:hypothetical protein